MGDVVRRREIRAEMDLLTYLVLRRHQRCRNLDRTRQETFLRGRTRGWTWPLTPWWTWRRTVTWPPSWEAIWRGGQTQIVNFWRPMKMRACQGKLIFKIDQKPTFSPTTNIWHGCSTVVVKVDLIGCGIGISGRQKVLINQREYFLHFPRE